MFGEATFIKISIKNYRPTHGKLGCPFNVENDVFIISGLVEKEIKIFNF